MGALCASIVVPATSANLGCAFDCAGIALDLYLRAEAAITDSPGFTISYRGADSGNIPLDESNLVAQAIERAAARSGAGFSIAPKSGSKGLKLDLHNEIPIGVGLGSSAAAIIAGTVLGSELCGLHLQAADLLRMALEIESHPDNLASAIYGGMVVAAISSDTRDVRIARTPVSEELDFIAVIPETPLPTAKSRAALPASYAREDVVANLQHTAWLTAAFFSGRQLSPEMFADRLHQPYRGALVPGIAECLAYRHEGLAGIFLSGAGSAIMAIVDRRGVASKSKIAADLAAEFRKQRTAARVLFLKADNSGTRVSNAAGERFLASPPK